VDQLLEVVTRSQNVQVCVFSHTFGQVAVALLKSSAQQGDSAGGVSFGKLGLIAHRCRAGREHSGGIL
jgi:hypothetical protein